MAGCGHHPFGAYGIHGTGCSGHVSGKPAAPACRSGVGVAAWYRHYKVIIKNVH